MSGPSGENVAEWAGGSLSELTSVLSAAALPSRIQVYGPGAGTALAGEVHLLAGGLSDALCGDLRGQDAVSALQRVAGARFVIETRLPDPETGSLTKPGPAQGNLAERPLVELMRYCEEYVLTCTLEVWRGEEQARISYRRGELVGTTVGGSDAPERLPDVMAWKEGCYELALPPPVMPPVPVPSRRNTGSAAVVGASGVAAPTRPPSGERDRRGTDPLISVEAIRKKTPTRPGGVMVRSTAEATQGSRVPPLPGLQDRVGAPGRPQPGQSATTGARPSPSVPPQAAPPVAPPTPAAPFQLAAKAPEPAPPTILGPPVSRTPATIRLGAPPVAALARTLPDRAAGASPRVPSPSPATKPAVPQSPAHPRSASAPEDMVTPRAVTPGLDLDATPRPVSPRVAVATSRAAAPSGRKTPPLGFEITPTPVVGTPAASVGRDMPAGDLQVTPPPVSSLPPLRDGAVAAKRKMLAQDPEATPPPLSPLPPLPADASAESSGRKTPAQESQAVPPPAAAASAGPADGAISRPGAQSRPSAARPSGPPAIRGAAAAAANMAPAVFNRTSGEIKPSASPAHGIDSHPHGAEANKRTTPGRAIEAHASSSELLPSVALPDDLQDPAALVDTPRPEMLAVRDHPKPHWSTPTPLSPSPEQVRRQRDRLSAFAAVRADGLGTDIGQPSLRSGPRRRRRGVGDWPLVVHVLLGIVLGLGIVVAYSAYYGLPLPLP